VMASARPMPDAAPVAPVAADAVSAVFVAAATRYAVYASAGFFVLAIPHKRVLSLQRVLDPIGSIRHADRVASGYPRDHDAPLLRQQPGGSSYRREQHRQAAQAGGTDRQHRQAGRADNLYVARGVLHSCLDTDRFVV